MATRKATILYIHMGVSNGAHRYPDNTCPPAVLAIKGLCNVWTIGQVLWRQALRGGCSGVPKFLGGSLDRGYLKPHSEVQGVPHQVELRCRFMTPHRTLRMTDRRARGDDAQQQCTQILHRHFGLGGWGSRVAAHPLRCPLRIVMSSGGLSLVQPEVTHSIFPAT